MSQTRTQTGGPLVDMQGIQKSFGAVRALHEARCAADGAKGAHGGIDAAGNHLAGARHQRVIEISAWFH